MPGADPVALVGSWKLVEAAGEGGAAAVLRLTLDELSVFRQCGSRRGSWRADSTGLFVGHVWAFDSEASGGCRSTPVWLARATTFRVEGDSRVLLDDRGGRVARLLPGGRLPAGWPDVTPSDREPPVITDEVRRAFAPAAALPAGLTPAVRETLLGRWVPTSRPQGLAGTPYAELRADGQWVGSDGCNGQSGRWVAGPSGALVATAGPSTLIGCDYRDVGSWLSTARRAGFDGEVLVLVDARGAETGRLQRQP